METISGLLDQLEDAVTTLNEMRAMRDDFNSGAMQEVEWRLDDIRQKIIGHRGCTCSK